MLCLVQVLGQGWKTFSENEQRAGILGSAAPASLPVEAATSASPVWQLASHWHWP